jgi:mRNA interferase MazF
MKNRGDVILVLFPDSNLRTAKRRPALVVQATGLGTGFHQVVIAMITSNMTRAGHPSRVTLRIGAPEAAGSGLRTNSVIMTDNLATVHENEIDRLLGSLADMNVVDAALKHTLGLP